MGNNASNRSTSASGNPEIVVECPKECPPSYDPICGFNKKEVTFKTFRNVCELKARNCAIPDQVYVNVFDGECPIIIED